MFASSFLFFLAAHPQAATISLDLSVASVPDILKAVSAKTGQQLAASGVVQNDFVFVKVKDVDSEVLLRRLADILGATWVSGNGVRTLTAPDNSLSESEQLYRTHVRKWADNLAKGLAKPVNFEASAKALAAMKEKANDETGYDWDKLQKIQEELPTGRFASTVVIRLVPELSQIKKGERVVFSFQPSRLQTALPASLRSSFDEFGRSYLQCREALVKHNVIGEEEDYMFDGPNSFNKPEPPKQFIVTATRNNEFLTVSIRFYDESGYFNIDLSKGMWGLFAEAQEDVDKEPSPFKDLTQPLKVTPKMVEYLPLAPNEGPAVRNPKSKPTREEILRLISIDKNEPLTSTPGEVLKQYADVVGKNVLAYVPDSALFSFFSLQGQDEESTKLTIGAMMPQLLRVGYLEKFEPRIEDKDGIVTLRDQNLSQARLERMPRLASANLFRSVYAKQRFDLDSVADFLQKNKYDECLQVVSQFAALAAGIDVNFPEDDDLKVLKFYAEFNQGAREQIKKSEVKLNPSVLTSRQKEIFAHFLYKTDSAVSNINDMSEQVNTKFGFQEQDRYSMGIGSIKEEPTFLLANGLPPNTVVRMSMLSKESIFERTDYDGYFSNEATSPMSIAYQIVYKEKGISEEYYGRPRKYMMGPSTKLELDIDLPTLGVISRKYMLDEIKTNGDWLDFEQMPQAVREEVLKQVEKVREQMKGVQVGGGGGRTVKPPMKFR